MFPFVGNLFPDSRFINNVSLLLLTLYQKLQLLKSLSFLDNIVLTPLTHASNDWNLYFNHFSGQHRSLNDLSGDASTA